ncbi:MAG: ATP-binding cassette domain-containing protein, partial [Eubacteriales bacterium]|nr:ATP-binding cassette domain-containing protein [Eubacteriales bacterium]
MIEVKGLYKDFGSLHVLRGVSLNVEQGDIISIIGPSGSGKSTLLRSINLLEKPTFGEIWVEGKLITPPDPYLHWDVIRASKTYGELCTQGLADEPAIMKIKKEDLLKPHEGSAYQKLMRQITREHFEDSYAVRRRVGMVFQHFNLFPHMTVLENMIYAPMKVNHVSREQAVAKARELLDEVGMLAKIDAYPGKLSG